MSYQFNYDGGNIDQDRIREMFEQNKKEIEGTANTVLIVVIVVVLVLMLVVAGTTLYCCKKKRVTEGIVIRGPPETQPLGPV